MLLGSSYFFQNEMPVTWSLIPQQFYPELLRISSPIEGILQTCSRGTWDGTAGFKLGFVTADTVPPEHG